MKRWAALSLLCGYAVSFACADHPVSRVVTVAPDLAALVAELGAADSLVGVSSYTDFPSSAKNLPIVATDQGMDLERIVSLHPDVVLAEGHAARLSDFSFPVVSIDVRQLSQIPLALEQIACALGISAKEPIKKFTEELAAIRKQYQHRAPRRVYFQVWSAPLITVNQDTLIGDAIAVCGGVNIFASLRQAFPVVSFESIVLANPEVMIADEPGWEKAWQAFPQIAAVSSGRLITLAPGALSKADTRVLSGVNSLCHALE